MTSVEIIKLCQEILMYVGLFSAVLYAYMSVYMIVGAFKTKKFPKTSNYHKYAIMIAARNEETVIANLIESINNQDYPSDKITVFVVADNCTDKTAQIAREHGAVCYERFNDLKRTKGYALEFLVDNIERDYGIDSFEAYMIFDADNLLKKDYVSRMNEAFDSGEKIITSYRNTKNFDDNWISSGYGIHWLRTIRCEHRPRSVFNLATRIQGTGFMFASEIIQDGWHYVSFTEDRAFAADAVVNGYRISYCDTAEFFDEQPTSLKIAFRQRIRWGKGHLQAFVESGPELFKGIFKSSKNQNKTLCESEANKENSDSITCRSQSSVKRRLMFYDMFLIVFPSNLFWLFINILDFFGNIALCFFVASFLSGCSGVIINTIIAFFIGYAEKMFLSVYVFITERNRIKRMSILKKVYYTIMWPLFDIIGSITILIALFTHVEWKPIPHNSNVDIEKVSLEVASKK